MDRSLSVRLSICISIVLITVSVQINGNILQAASPPAIIYTNQASLQLSDPTAVNSGSFGLSIAVTSDDILLGSQAYPNSRVGVFDRSTGQFIRDLTPTGGNPNDLFGYDVAASGTTAIVGARQGSAAYLFNLTTGQELRKLTVPSGQYFGYSVAISGNTALVSDTYYPMVDPYSNKLINNGAVFAFDVSTGNLIQTFHNPVPLEDNDVSGFGSSVAIQGDNVVIGAPGDGKAYQFSLSTGQQLHTMQFSNLGPLNAFLGMGLSIDSGKVAIGDPGNQAVWLYDLNTGSQIGKLSGTGLTQNDGFGQSVDLSGGLALVGAPDVTVGGVIDAGTAYVFDTATQQLVAEVLPDNPQFNVGLGSGVQLDGTTAYLGAPGMNNFVGAAYVITVPEPAALPMFLIGALVLMLKRRC